METQEDHLNNKNQINEKQTENSNSCKVENQNNIVEDQQCAVRIAVVGNVDSGKSTLVGVLTKGMPDDGRGAARLRVFNYPHEATNGRTSSVAQEIMGFNNEGQQVFPDRYVQNKNKYWSEVVNRSKRVVSLVDQCGHEKYQKTTMLGMVGLVPDYAMIIVGANMGISRMTKEHLGITLALKIPFFVVVTKCDMTPEEVTKQTINDLNKLMKASSVNRKPFQINQQSDVDFCANSQSTDKICPILKISSVTGTNIDWLTRFIYKLQNRLLNSENIKSVDDPVEFDIHDKFTVTGSGQVVSGICKSGTIKNGMTQLCGPDRFKQFKAVIVKSIHVNRVIKESTCAGNFCTLAIKAANKKDDIAKKDFRKGMSLLDPKLKPSPAMEFDAEVVILHHSTTIKRGYQVVVHCGVIRQAVSIEGMSAEIQRTNDKGFIRFRFLYHPEYIKANSTIQQREGRTKILGEIAKVYRVDEVKEDQKY